MVGVGIVLISLQNHVIQRAFSLTEPCTKNVAEYNALLIGLQLAHHLGPVVAHPLDTVTQFWS